MSFLQTPNVPVLVILGNWNHTIFTHEWIKANLYPDQDLIVEPSPAPNSTILFGSESYKIFVQDNRLTFLAHQLTSEAFGLIEEKVIQITSILKHTHVIAFGINCLIVSGYNQKLSALKLKEDQEEMVAKGFVLDTFLLHRIFTKDTYQLTISMNLSAAEVSIDTNMNFQISSINLFHHLFIPGFLNDKINEIKKLLTDMYYS